MRFHVEDMTCGHCTAAIEKAVAAAGGRATADLASKRPGSRVHGFKKRQGFAAPEWLHS